MMLKRVLSTSSSFFFKKKVWCMLRNRRKTLSEGEDSLKAYRTRALILLTWKRPKIRILEKSNHAKKTFDKSKFSENAKTTMDHLGDPPSRLISQSIRLIYHHLICQWPFAVELVPETGLGDCAPECAWTCFICAFSSFPVFGLLTA